MASHQGISDELACGDEADAFDTRVSARGDGKRIAVLRSVVSDVVAAGLNVVLPPVCLSCHEPLSTRNSLCSACWRDVTFIRPPVCDALGLPMPFGTGERMVSAAAQSDPPVFQRARAVAMFDGVMRKLVHDFKYRDRLETRVLFGQWMAQAGQELLDDAEVIVPVPLNRWRLLGRRFNQSALLAREVSKSCSAVYDPHALVRTRRTRAQVGLSPSQRKTNVRGAFKVPTRRRQVIEGSKILVVDDVLTTGATAGACARVLLATGAREVNVLVLALAPRGGSMTT